MQLKVLIPLSLICVAGAFYLGYVRGRNTHSSQDNAPQVHPKVVAIPDKVMPTPLPVKANPIENTVSNTVEGKVTPQSLANVNKAEDTQLEQASQILLDTNQSDATRNETINLLRRSNYPNLSDTLIKILNDPNEGERFRRFCVQHLGIEAQTGTTAQKEKVVTILHESLSDRHLGVRREALLALVNVNDQNGKETAVKWLLDENADDTRDLAIRCVQQMDMKEHIPEVRKYVYNDNEVIRIAAIVALSQWGDEESLPAFFAASKSENTRVQRAGKAALERLNEKSNKAKE